MAESRIGWAFWPPGSDVSVVAEHVEPDAGIWIPHAGHRDEEREPGSESENEEGSVEDPESDGTSDVSDSTENDSEEEDAKVGFGRFGALSLDDEY